MRTESRVFGLLAGAMFGFAFVYAVSTKLISGGYELVGIVALALSGVLSGMISTQLWLVSRRIRPRPEDKADADPDAGAGDVGFFSPFSYYPFGVAAAAFVAGLGMVVWELWLVLFGLVAVISATAGMLFEYYTGSRRESA